MNFRMFFLLVCACSATTGAQAADLRGYRAGYRLIPGTLADEFQSVTGRMTREVRDTCAAWSTVQDAQIDGTLHDGRTEIAALHSETTEAHDRLSFEFSSSSAAIGSTSTLTGRMVRDRVSAPWQLRFTRQLSGVQRPEQFLQLSFDTLLPMSYARALIDALGNGKAMFIAPLYNGVDVNPLEYSSRTQAAHPLPSVPALAGLRGWVVEQRVDGQSETRIVTRQIAENGVLASVREVTALGVLNWELTELTLLEKDCSAR